MSNDTVSHQQQQQEIFKKPVQLTLNALEWFQLIQLLKAVCVENPEVLPSPGGDLVPMDFNALLTITNLTASMEQQLIRGTDWHRLAQMIAEAQAAQPKQSTAFGFAPPKGPEPSHDTPPAAT